MKTILKVHGMHCKSCEVLLTDVIGEITGVTNVQASHAQGTVTVEHTDSGTLEKIKSAIRQEGYQVLA